MSDLRTGLTFDNLREANIKRLENTLKFAKSKDWSIAQWERAVTGEWGEYSNFMKKVDRGDFDFSEAKEDVAKELADVQIYLDLLCHKLDIDLGEAVVSKFNEVSEKVNSPIVMKADGHWSYSEAFEPA